MSGFLGGRITRQYHIMSTTYKKSKLRPQKNMDISAIAHLAQLIDRATDADMADAAERAFKILEGTLNVTQATQDAWAETWTAVLGEDSSLWRTMTQRIAPIICALSLVYLTLTDVTEAARKQSWSELINMFVWPLVIVIMLGANNGQGLAGVAIGLRNIGYELNKILLEAQINDTRLDQAIRTVAMTQSGMSEINMILTECQGKVAEEYDECLEINREEIDRIIERAEEQAGGPLNTLKSVAEFLFTEVNPAGRFIDTGIGIATGDFFREEFVPIVKVILMAIQWAFVNTLEAAILLTALVSPLALAASILPLGGKPIVGWLIGYISLLSMQLYYNILVGLIAVIITTSGAETFADVGFLMFIAIFSPFLSILLASGGGTALFQAMLSQVKTVADVSTNLIGVAVGKLPH
jgi:hypothetical protein